MAKLTNPIRVEAGRISVSCTVCKDIISSAKLPLPLTQTVIDNMIGNPKFAVLCERCSKVFIGGKE